MRCKAVDRLKCVTGGIFLAFVPLLVTTATYAATIELIAGGFNQPMTVTSAAGDARLFVAEKGGIVRAIDRQTGTSSVFLDLSARVSTQGERGLLGLTFDPNFQSNGRFYVNYSDASTGHTIIERYQTSSGGLSAGNPASAYRLMTIEQPANTSHKAGWIGFRPGEPNNLYIATGDGAWHPTEPDPNKTAQNLKSSLGKILRIDVTTSTVDRNYGVPNDNSFTSPNQPGVTPNPEIWAYGLRNPFRNSFDRLTGSLYIADVGFSALDEVNYLAAGAPAGANFGWSVREGNQGPQLPGATDPILNISIPTTGAALVGGIVYRGPIESLDGMYFYADFVNQTVKSFRYNAATGQITDQTDWTALWFSSFGGVRVTSFGEDALGNLFLTDFESGRLFGLTPDPVPLPPALTLFASALIGGGVVAWRTKRKQKCEAIAA